MSKLKTIVLLAIVLVVASSVLVQAANSPKYKSASLDRRIDYAKAISGNEEVVGTAPARTWGTFRPAGSPPPGSPGYRIGDTYYDYQHNGSTGRQVDHSILSGAHVVQATWMNGTAAGMSATRKIFWNKMSVTGSPANITLDNSDVIKALPLGSLGTVDGTDAVSTANRPGYTNLRNRPNGRGVAIMHDAPLPEDPGISFWMGAIDATAGGGVFLQNNSPQPAGIGDGAEVIWPKSCIDIVGSDTILHTVARGSDANADYSPIYYWRGDINGNSITWSTPIYIDSTATISPVVEADPNSDEVAIVYTKAINMAYTGGLAQNYCDVIVRKSANGGSTWGGAIYALQQDTLVAGQLAYTDVAALYDDNGTLHVLFNTRDWREDAGELSLFNTPVRMVHWNDVRLTRREIATLDMNNACNLEGNPFTIGAWNLAMAKPGLTVKPAGVYGANEIFYAVWVQAGPDTADCATQSDSSTLGGYVNNELWCSASSDDGLTWDRPQNITGTRTPDCVPGDCHSEHWVSAAARADSGIYLSYVDDSHAGGIVQGEGAWSLSDYMLYAPEARLPVVEPRIAVTPTSFLEEHVNPGGSNSVQITIQNQGNATLNYQVQVTNDDGGQSHVLVENLTTYSSSIAAAGAAHVLDVDFDGIGLPNPSEQDWRLEVTSNDATNDPGQGGTAIDVDLNVFVASPWFTCVRDTISNGSRLVGVSNCLALGNQGGGTGLKSIANNSEYIFEASPVLSFASSTPAQRLSWVDMFWGSVADRSRDSNRAYRAQSGITMQMGVANPAPGDDTLTANIATGTATTTDSVFQLAWEVRTFNNPGYTDGFVAKYDVTEFDDPGFSGVLSVGAAADLDVDSMSAFNDGITNGAQSRQYIGARGGYGNTDSAQYTPQNKWAALFYIPLDSECDNAASGGQVLDNPAYVYPEGNFNRDSLRTRMDGIIGWNAANFPTDSISDLSVLMKAGSVAFTGTQNISFAFGATVSDISIADLEAKIGKLRSALNAACIAGCLITLNGDQNNSGTVTSADIITLVGYVFKGGAAPVPCVAAGDVNCSGTVTSADIITLVGYVFKGGAPPCNICDNSPMAGSCQ